ncbi:MAG: HXXEE domain-containing protein [Muribaculaceae bacterium]
MLLPLTFCVHDAEEALMLQKWLRTHAKTAKQRYAVAARVIKQLSKLSTKAFIIAAVEELAILIIATAYYIAEGPYADYIWIALALAFTLHIVVHLFQAIILRGYVPGVITGVALLPYSLYLWRHILNGYSAAEITLLGISGIAFMAINLVMAHGLGKALAREK